MRIPLFPHLIQLARIQHECLHGWRPRLLLGEVEVAVVVALVTQSVVHHKGNSHGGGDDPEGELRDGGMESGEGKTTQVSTVNRCQIVTATLHEALGPLFMLRTLPITRTNTC